MTFHECQKLWISKLHESFDIFIIARKCDQCSWKATCKRLKGNTYIVLKISWSIN